MGLSSGHSSHNNMLLWSSMIIVMIGAGLYYHIESKEVDIVSPTPIVSTHEFPQIGLTFETQPDFVVESTSDENAFTMTVQKGSPPDEYYQLYMITQLDLPEEVTTKNLESAKKDLEQDSVEDTTVAGYPAASGQIKGERNRFVTYFVKDGQLYTVATAEPTEENIQITQKILSTFQFND